jgi:hypothetical protein
MYTRVRGYTKEAQEVRAYMGTTRQMRTWGTKGQDKGRFSDKDKDGVAREGQRGVRSLTPPPLSCTFLVP